MKRESGMFPFEAIADRGFKMAYLTVSVDHLEVEEERLHDKPEC